MFVALNALKKSDDLCKVIGPLKGGTLVCGSIDYTNELDRLALCKLVCCCKDEPKKQVCVDNVLWSTDDLLGGKSYYKAEVPYLKQAPIMSKNDKARATRNPYHPKGSRVPDVVVVQDSSLPPTLDNIQKVYEIKFPPDRYTDDIADGIDQDGMTQYEAYKKLARGKIDKEPMGPDNCNCDDDQKNKVLAKALAWQEEQESATATNSNTAGNVNAAAKAISVTAIIYLIVEYGWPLVFAF